MKCKHCGAESYDADYCCLEHMPEFWMLWTCPHCGCENPDAEQVCRHCDEERV